MSRRRFLPKYVTSFNDRHGKEHLRFRRVGYPSGYFQSAFGTEEFRTEYRQFMDGPTDTVANAIERASPGTVNDLVTRYFATPARLGPTALTQGKVRAVISKFREGRGDRRVADVTFEHIDAIVARKLIKTTIDTPRGPRAEGGIHAARKLRKELVRLFDFAVKLGMRPDNPVTHSEQVKVSVSEKTEGFHTWTEDEIAQYRAHHTLGTKGRLAMELMLWTGQRRSDALKMGRQHIKEGRISVRQGKTGKELKIPVAPQLNEAILAVPGAAGQLCFLVTERGRPFSEKGFGNWFRKRCDEAGLPHCSAHGLRKAMMRRLAELGQSNQSLKSVSGHTRDDQVAHYTRAVDQRRMADHAIGQLSDSEMSNPVSRLDTEAAKTG